MQDWQFYREMPVYDQSGRLVGRVEEIGHGVDYLHVRQGNLLIRDWYVPMDAVASVTSRGVHLSAARQALRANRWNVPPPEFLERQGMTPGYEYTSPGDMPRYSSVGESETPS